MMILYIKRHLLFLLLLSISLTGYSQTRTLDYYLDEGIRNSPLLKDIDNQLSSSSVDSLLIEAQRKPVVEGISQLLYSPYNSKIGYDEVITDGGNYQAVAAVTQEIFNRRKIENRYQALDYLKETTSLSKKLSVAELRRSITNLYLESYSVYSELVFNRSFLDLMKEENQIIGNFVANGVCTQTDYLSMLVETEGQQVIVIQLTNQYKKEIMLLNEVCGIVDTSNVILNEPDIELAEVNNPSDYLFLKQYIIDSLQIMNDKAAIVLNYKPTVRWFADAGILTSNPWNFYRHFGASAGISLSIPVYDGHQKKLEEQKLAIKENTRSFYNLSSRKHYDQNYLRLREELNGISETRARLEKQLDMSDQLVKSLKAQLESGIIKMTDYLNAIKNYRNTNRNLNIIKIEMLSIINEMNYLLTR
jgi:outer membrane protein TolC